MVAIQFRAHQLRQLSCHSGVTTPNEGRDAVVSDDSAPIAVIDDIGPVTGEQIVRIETCATVECVGASATDQNVVTLTTVQMVNKMICAFIAYERALPAPPKSASLR